MRKINNKKMRKIVPIMIGALVIGSILIVGFPPISYNGSAISAGKLEKSLKGDGTEKLLAVEWSPDGNYIVGGYYEYYSVVYEVSSGNDITIFHHEGCVEDVDFSPDSSKIVSGSSSNEEITSVWEANTGNLIWSQSVGLESVDWSPDGEKIAVVDFHSEINVLDAQSGDILASHDQGSLWITDLSWSPDSSKIAFAAENGLIEVIDSGTGNVLQSIVSHESKYDENVIVRSVDWSPDGSKLVSGADDSKVKVWDYSTGNMILTLSEHTDGVKSVKWSPDGSKIAASGYHENIIILDSNSGNILYNLPSDDNGTAMDLSWSPDSTKLASAHYDGEVINIWDVNNRDVSDKGFISSYWWIILLVIVTIVTALFFLYKNRMNESESSIKESPDQYTAEDPMQKLEELKDTKDKGLISDEEYENKKQEILKDL